MWIHFEAKFHDGLIFLNLDNCLSINFIDENPSMEVQSNKGSFTYLMEQKEYERVFEYVDRFVYKSQLKEGFK